MTPVLQRARNRNRIVKYLHFAENIVIRNRALHVCRFSLQCKILKTVIL